MQFLIPKIKEINIDLSFANIEENIQANIKICKYNVCESEF